MNALQTLHDHLDAGGLLAGYDVAFFRWYGEHTAQDAPPTLLLRPVGGGTANELGQAPDVLIAMCGARYGQGDVYDHLTAIRNYLIENFTIPGVANFEILADINGPYFLDNERPVAELNVRMWT